MGDHKIETVRRFRYLGTVMTPMTKRKKSELRSWQQIKPTDPWKPYSDPNKFAEKIKTRLYKTLIKQYYAMDL